MSKELEFKNIEIGPETKKHIEFMEWCNKLWEKQKLSLMIPKEFINQNSIPKK